MDHATNAMNAEWLVSGTVFVEGEEIFTRVGEVLCATAIDDPLVEVRKG